MKTFTLEATKHPDLFRVVDRDGNWEHYWHKPSNTYLRGSTTILALGYNKGPWFNKWLSEKTPDEQKQILSAATTKGDKVHRWIDLALSAEPGVRVHERKFGVFSKESKQEELLSNDEWSCILSFSEFWKRHEPILIRSEAPVFNLGLGYAGTADMLIILTKSCGVRYCKCFDLIGKVGLWDNKTSSGIRDEHSAQAASYANAENLNEYINKPMDYIAILRLGTTHVSTGGYEMQPFQGDQMKNAFDRFLAAKTIAALGYKPFDPAIDIVDIPDSVTINLNIYDPKKETSAVEQRKEVPGNAGEQTRIPTEQHETKHGESTGAKPVSVDKVRKVRSSTSKKAQSDKTSPKRKPARQSKKKRGQSMSKLPHQNP